MSKYPSSFVFEECDNGADCRELLLLVLRLCVERKDGGLDSFPDDMRSGITTTGTPPSRMIFWRDLWLEEVVLKVVFDAKLPLCRSRIRSDLWTKR